jgi:hypothetical protein
MCEKRVLRRICAPKNDEVIQRLEKTAQCGASYLVLFAKYNENEKIKENAMGRACHTHGGKNNMYRILVGKARRKETAEKS